MANNTSKEVIKGATDDVDNKEVVARMMKAKEDKAGMMTMELERT